MCVYIYIYIYICTYVMTNVHKAVNRETKVGPLLARVPESRRGEERESRAVLRQSRCQDKAGADRGMQWRMGYVGICRGVRRYVIICKCNTGRYNMASHNMVQYSITCPVSMPYKLSM